MFGKIEHLGIAVKDLNLANKTYEKLLGRKPYKSEAVESEKVITSFFKSGKNKRKTEFLHLNELYGDCMVMV